MTNPPQHLLCFSHLRWDFVFQRPQHLLSRFAKQTNVYFFEEPIYDSDGTDYLNLVSKGDRLTIVTPHLCQTKSDHRSSSQALSVLLDTFLDHAELGDWAFWYYTPMALEYSEKYRPKLIIYDCMDELSAFKFAPPTLPSLEKQLMDRADLVFTGGHSLYEAKKGLHHNIFPMPSSIDKQHFAQAREQGFEPADQSAIAGPKIGFFGVIDERFDIDLIRTIAELRPNWQLVIIGPVVKIDSATLPQNQNIHYLGQKSYDQLPAYLRGWDIALIPFMINESTRYISPTKTPEYLAAGIPVISTPIRDVIQPYGISNIVSICDGAIQFIEAIEVELQSKDRKVWLAKVDAFLQQISWDHTYANIVTHMQQAFSSDKTVISIAS